MGILSGYQIPLYALPQLAGDSNASGAAFSNAFPNDALPASPLGTPPINAELRATTAATSLDFQRFINALPPGQNANLAAPMFQSGALGPAELLPPPPRQIPPVPTEPPNTSSPLNYQPTGPFSAPNTAGQSPFYSTGRPDLSSQPAVENYVPDEQETFPVFAWGGTWWESQTSGAMRPLLTSREERIRRVEVEHLIWLSTQHSQRVKSIVSVPKIQGTAIEVARGDFDPLRFAQSKFHDTSDPVGNTLTTGGPSRLNDTFWENSLGIKDRNTYGGRTEFAQAINGQNSNSLFFVPQNQVDSKLRLNYTQPTMRGAGVAYNTSAITIEEFKTAGALAKANQELQDHAVQIHRVYWSLSLSRFNLVQSINARSRFVDIKRRLQDREGRDLLSMYIHRVDRSIAEQDAVIAENRARMRGLQANLAALVGAPELQRTECDEIIPASIPVATLPAEETMHDEYYNVLMYRGDLQEIRNEISVASVQKQMAYNEVKPTLDLVLESYVRGLEGDNRLFESFMRQFNTGTPSYAAGLIYQSPYRNRAANANKLGRTIALEKLSHDFEFKLMEASSHVFHAIEKTKGTYLGIYAALRAAEAAVAEVESYNARLGDYFHEPASTSSLLNDLIDAETRLLATEQQLANKQIEHMQALIQIKYESGTLLTLSYD